MLANPPKHSRPVLSECNALYYFPEIPCAAEGDRKKQSARGRFVGMASESTRDSSVSQDNLEEMPQVRELIEKAFSKGVEQGREETTAAQQDTIETAAGALGKALAEATRIRMQECERMESETVRLAMAIAKKVIGHAAEYKPVVETVVKAAMKKVADRRHLTLKLNPGDLETVAALKNEL